MSFLVSHEEVLLLSHAGVGCLLRQRVPYHGGYQAKAEQPTGKETSKTDGVSTGQSDSHSELAPLQPLQDAIEIVGTET